MGMAARLRIYHRAEAQDCDFDKEIARLRDTR
jgi:hypothetical protein